MMKTFAKTPALLAAAALLAAGFAMNARAGGSEEHMSKKSHENVVQALTAKRHFKTLVKAVGAADLVETLQGPGPFTVFAPTDRAFQRVPKTQLDALMSDTPKLKSVLLYHVVSGDLTRADLEKETALTTVNGATLPVTMKGGHIYVGDTRVWRSTRAGNGVVYTIGKVLMPPESHQGG